MRRYVLITGLALLSTMFATAMMPARAEDAGMPPDIAAKIKTFGRVINPPEVAAIYAPLQAREPYPGVKVTRDVKYGTADRNLLDVFTPEIAASPRPVLIFVHGGGFAAGNKHNAGAPFYDNIMLAAVKSGAVGVNITYRLAPAYQWPAGAEDVGASVRWVVDHISAFGGDPSRIYLMGHSAGAVHVASFLAAFGPYAAKGTELAGAILVSGEYDLTALTPGAAEKAYFGEDTSQYRERSPLPGLLKSKVPLLVVNAELDPPTFIQQGEELRDNLCKEGRCPTTLVLANHSHISELYAINTSDTVLWNSLSKFMQQAGAQ
ncbi:triacylglycerol lipase [Rhizobiales bacterium GAS188]|nr:triacylglycerol lipase [Rhizobiales bacterium GAS188]